MPIGDSKGAFYEDEFHRAVENWNSFNGDDRMVVTPNQSYQNKQLEFQDYKVMGGIEIGYNTPLPNGDTGFKDWKDKYAPKDSGEDYDLRGAYLAGVTPADNGHMPDTYKKPNHPTFSDQSQYFTNDTPAGTWNGDEFIPPSIQ